MKNTFVPFWTWNKRKSPMTMTPSKVPSRKGHVVVRTLRKLSGVRSGFAALVDMRKARKGNAQ